MKKVIDGLTYNTETAAEIGFASYGYSGDHSAFEETLYKTKKGRFFLAGEGGPRSRWGEQVDQNTWGGGSGIRAMSTEDALYWCEENEIDADVIANHFEVEEA